ncbi:RloB family protein [Micromonospora sp. DT227]|uniref:RloB family protein n=1 Tax=Micromonospora sp. DT227 TaxID=3393433 RepID=UPI003CF56E05
MPHSSDRRATRLPPRKPTSAHGLQRRRGNREVRQRFLLLCEGEVTEREYFEHLRKELRGTLVTIEISRDSGEPLNLVREACRMLRDSSREAKRAGDDYMRYDSVWCICDVDEHRRLEAAIELAMREGVNMAISNPCFEIWPALHFDPCTRYMSAGDLRSIIRQHQPGYEKSLDCQKLNGRQAEAIRRAMALDKQHARNGNPPGSNPSTGVWQLVRKLAESAGSPAVR